MGAAGSVQRVGVVPVRTSSAQASRPEVTSAAGAVVPAQGSSYDWTQEILAWDWRGRLSRARAQLNKDYKQHFNRTWYRFLWVWSWHLDRYFARIREQVHAHEAKSSKRSRWWHGILGWWHGIDDKRRLLVLKDLKDQLKAWSESDADPDAEAIEKTIAASLQIKGLEARCLTEFLLRLSCVVYIKEVLVMGQNDEGDEPSVTMVSRPKTLGEYTLVDDGCELTNSEATAIGFLERVLSYQFVSDLYAPRLSDEPEILPFFEFHEMRAALSMDARLLVDGVAVRSIFPIYEALFPVLRRMKSFDRFKPGAVVGHITTMLDRYKEIRPDPAPVEPLRKPGGGRKKAEPIMVGMARVYSQHQSIIDSELRGNEKVFAVLARQYKACWQALSAEYEKELSRCESIMVGHMAILVDQQMGMALTMVQDRQKALALLRRGSMYYRVWGVEKEARFKARYDREVMGAINQVLDCLDEQPVPQSPALRGAIERFRECAALLKNPEALLALHDALDGKDCPNMDRWLQAHQSKIQTCLRRDLPGVTRLCMEEWKDRKGLRKALKGVQVEREQLDSIYQTDRARAMEDRLAYGAEEQAAISDEIAAQLKPRFESRFKALDAKTEEIKAKLVVTDKLPARMRALEGRWEVFKAAREAWEKLDKSLEINLSCELSHVDDTTIADFSDFGGAMSCEAWLYYVRPLNHYAIYYHDRETLYVEEADGRRRYLMSEEAEQAARRAERDIKTERKRTWHVLGRDGAGQVHRFAMDLDNLLPPWDVHADLLQTLSELSRPYWKDPVVLQVICYPLLETLSDLVGTPLFTPKAQGLDRVNDGGVNESGYVDVSLTPDEDARGGDYQWRYRQHYRAHYLPLLKLLGLCERLVRMSRMLITDLYDGEEAMPAEAWALLVRTSWGGETPLPSLRELDAHVNDEQLFHDGMKEDEEVYAKMTSAETDFNVTYGALRHHLLSVIREKEQESIDGWCKAIMGDEALQGYATRLKKAYQKLMIRRGMDGRFDKLFDAMEPEIKQMFGVQLDRISEMGLKRYKRVEHVLRDAKALRAYIFSNYIGCLHKGMSHGILQSDEDAGHKWGIAHEYRVDMGVRGMREMLLKLEQIKADRMRLDEESAEHERAREVSRLEREKLAQELEEDRRQYAIEHIHTAVGSALLDVKNAQAGVRLAKAEFRAAQSDMRLNLKQGVPNDGSEVAAAENRIPMAEKQAQEEAARAEEIKAHARVLLAALGAQLEDGDGSVEEAGVPPVEISDLDALDADVGVAAAGPAPEGLTQAQIAAARARFNELVGSDVVGDNVDLMGTYTGGEPHVVHHEGALGALLNGRRAHEASDTNGAMNGHARGHHHYEDDPDSKAGPGVPLGNGSGSIYE